MHYNVFACVAFGRQFSVLSLTSIFRIVSISPLVIVFFMVFSEYIVSVDALQFFDRCIEVLRLSSLAHPVLSAIVKPCALVHIQ